MTSIDDLRQTLQEALTLLPFVVADEIREEFAAVGQQATSTLRTSKDEQRISSLIQHAGERGGETVTSNLNRMSEVIQSAASTW